MKELLEDLNERTIAASGLDIQMLGTQDFENFQEFLEELIQFMFSCLNGREEGVLIAGIDCTEVGLFKLTGVSFSDDKLKNLMRHLEMTISGRVSVRHNDGNFSNVHVKDVLGMIGLKLYEVNAGTSSQATITALVVVPKWNVCKDLLYVLVDERKRKVYCRVQGHTTQLKGSQLIQMQQQVHQQFILQK